MNNEAAEKLRKALGNGTYGAEYGRLLDDALAAERRATVERIRARLNDDSGFRFEVGGEVVYADETLHAILDEEAGR